MIGAIVWYSLNPTVTQLHFMSMDCLCSFTHVKIAICLPLVSTLLIVHLHCYACIEIEVSLLYKITFIW